MIHGSKKSKRQKTQQQLKDQHELSEKINSKLAEFFAIPRQQVTPQQIPKYLQFIGLLMQLVSDIPTVFNFRRQLIQQATKDQTPEEVGKILAGEIKLTTKLIQSDSKSYTIWTFRQWLVKALFKINPDVIKAQKELIKMLLLRDEKNFHVWTYRNWLNSIQSVIDEQIEFTDQKIKSNPFNFSPYHYRTKFIHQKTSQLLKTEITSEQRQQILTFGMPKKHLLAELQKIKTALFLNPNEQAPWLYYNWLLSQLVPAFVVKQQKLQQNEETIIINMKISNFAPFIEGENITLKSKVGKLQSHTWQLTNAKQNTKISSNLSKNHEIKLESTGRLFLGNEDHKEWIDKHIKQIFKQSLKFIDEVIESEEEEANRRFAFLQKGAVCKLILQCGTTQKQFIETVQLGAASLKSIQNEQKASKYIRKQIQYWTRLERQQLTELESILKSKYS